MAKLGVDTAPKREDFIKQPFLPQNFPNTYHMCGSDQYGILIPDKIFIEYCTKPSIPIFDIVVCSNCKSIARRKMLEIPPVFTKENILKLIKAKPFNTKFMWYEALSGEPDEKFTPGVDEDLQAYNKRIKILWKAIEHEERNNPEIKDGH